MNISQTARDAAERYHQFALNYPELAARSLPEFIQSAMDSWIDRNSNQRPIATPDFVDPYKYVQ